MVFFVALLVAAGLFLFVPGSRPGFVKGWIRQAQGLGPAKTPKEALERFQKAVQKRDFETAATFCTADYADQMRRASKGATTLATAADGLLHNLEHVSHLNSPEAKALVRYLQPFPGDFTYQIQHKDGEPTARATLVLDVGPRPQKTYDVDPRIFLSFVPDTIDAVVLKAEGDKDKVWKIDFPVTTYLRDKVDYLKDNYGNYARALDNLKDAASRDSAAKADFESQLSTELHKAK
jgi:hypothetical protein